MNFFSVVDINTEQNAPLAMKYAAGGLKHCQTSQK